MNRTTLLLAALAATLSPSLAPGQRDTTAIIRGAVTDSAGRAIEAAEVFAPGSGRGVRTGSDGRFALTGMFPGTTRLLVRRLGWMMLDTAVTSTSGNAVDVHVSLRRIAQDLARVLIVANNDCPIKTLEGFECRRRAAKGVFRDTAEFAPLKPIWPADLLYGVDGLRRVSTSAGPAVESTTGWRCLTTLIDGRRAYPGEAETLRITDFVALEFYDDSKNVPEWYRSLAFQGSSRRGTPGRSAGPGRECALVIYWTRRAPRFDPGLDQSKDVTRAREARQAAQKRLLDSLRVRADSSAIPGADTTLRKKPE